MSTLSVVIIIAVAVYLLAIGVPLFGLIRYSLRRQPRRVLPKYSTDHIAELLVASRTVSQAATPVAVVDSTAAA